MDSSSIQNAKFFIDVRPLFEREWTGIPVVAANLARQFLKHNPNQTIFFYEDRQVSTECVQDSLRRDTGWYLSRDFHSGDADSGSIGDQLLSPCSIGLYPSVKSQRHPFHVEASIFHDLSTLVLPEYHVAQNILYHRDSMKADLDSNSLTFCVSEACKSDVVAYFGISEDLMRVVPNGVSWPAVFEAKFSNEFSHQTFENFVFILGTREPRKNIRILFELIEMHPEVIDKVRFVFSGKPGWLEEMTSASKQIREHIDSGRILLTGYISEYNKYCLIRSANFCVYPSMFEGFGLPVLESMSVGTQCLTSVSSSLPEVGFTELVYFDPMSVHDLYKKFSILLSRTSEEKLSDSERLVKLASVFNWERSFHIIMKELLIAARMRGFAV